MAGCIFRAGAAAVLLSNKASMRRTAKYELLHSVTANVAADDKAFGCGAGCGPTAFPPLRQQQLSCGAGAAPTLTPGR